MDLEKVRHDSDASGDAADELAVGALVDEALLENQANQRVELPFSLFKWTVRQSALKTDAQ